MKAAVQPMSQPIQPATFLDMLNSDVDLYDEEAVYRGLTDQSITVRSQTLEQLRNFLRTQHYLPFRNHTGLYVALSTALTDTTWDIRNHCIMLITETIPLLKKETDDCMVIVLPRIISFIGDGKIAIRRSVIQCLHVYMKHTADISLLMTAYVAHGTENNDIRIRKEAIVSIPLLVTPEFASEDFTAIVASLCKKLVDRNVEPQLQQLAKISLGKIRTNCGDSNFRKHLMGLAHGLREFYCQTSGFNLEPNTNHEISPPENSRSYSEESRPPSMVSEPLKYGLIPVSTWNKISDEGFRVRAQGVEELKIVLESQHDLSRLLPNIKQFIETLNRLLDDTNFKIITNTLDIMGLVVERAGHEIRPYLVEVINTLTKRMGDNKNVIRQGIYKVIKQLMQSLGPKLVLLLLNDNLNHRNSRIRAETVNCIIFSLLTFPSYEFDLNSLCSTVADSLTDPKKSVRHAAIECIAVLAQCLGAGKLQPLQHAIQSIESKIGQDQTEGLQEAVHARLTRRVLPRCNDDNLIEYATSLPNLNSSRNGSLGQHGPDVDWIMAGNSGAGNSARSMRVEDIESSSRQSSASLDGRRYLSAGKKSKLPWEDNQAKSPVNDIPTGKSKQWSEEKSSRSGTLPRASKSRDDLVVASMSFSKSGSMNDINQAVNYTNPSSPKVSAIPTVSKSGTQKALASTWSVSKSTYADGNVRSNGGTPILNPIDSGIMASQNNTWVSTSTDVNLSESQSSIPNKPSSVKRSTPKSKVPPISKSHSPVNPDDLRYDHNSNEIPQISESLQNKIRNSASKKKAERLFQRAENKEKTNPDVSLRSPTDSSLSSSSRQSTTKPALTKIDKPPNNKPSTRESKSEPLHTGNGLVGVVGKGYSDEITETPPKPTPRPAPRHKPKPAAPGSNLSPLGYASSSAPGMIPVGHENEDLGAVVGKGMFDGDTTRRTDRSNSLSKTDSSLKSKSPEDNSDDEIPPLNMDRRSSKLKEKAAQKKRAQEEQRRREREEERQLLEEEERRQIEEERQIQQEEQREREAQKQHAVAHRQREVAQRQREAVELKRKKQEAEERHQQVPIIEPRASPMKVTRANKERERVIPSAASSASTFIGDDVYEPFNNPQLAYKDALKKLAQDDWNVKCDGINLIRRLAHCHADVLKDNNLHGTTLALIQEAKNLRTQVSRLSIVCIGDMFSNLRKAMDPDLEAVCKVLLHKNGEANEFIRTELDRTLSTLINETTPQRALLALILGGVGHKNSTVRKVAAQHMVTISEKLGAGRLLSGVKDVTDRVLPAISSLVMDASPETRWYAKKMLLVLMGHPDFESTLPKHMSSREQKTVKDAVENLKLKGLGDMPSDAPSAKGTRRSGTFNRGSRQNSAEQSSVGNGYPSIRTSGFGSSSDNLSLLDNMSSKDWSKRYDSITELSEMVASRIKQFTQSHLKILDRYAFLIKDSNSKVQLHAIQSFNEIVPQIRDFINSQTLNPLIQNTGIGMASKNKEIQTTSANLLNTFINNIDHVMLFQPFVQVAANATNKTKPYLLNKVAVLTRSIYHSKPKAVILHGLPLAFGVVPSLPPTGELRSAVAGYLAILHQLMDDSLFDHAASYPNASPAFVTLVRTLTNEGLK